LDILKLKEKGEEIIQREAAYGRGSVLIAKTDSFTMRRKCDQDVV
jgi:hypothetical protein